MWPKLRRARRIAALRRQLAELESAGSTPADVQVRSPKPTRSDYLLASLFGRKSSRENCK
jgi:hypothetical protein